MAAACSNLATISNLSGRKVVKSAGVSRKFFDIAELCGREEPPD
jgi:hypothetical protein